MAEVDLLNLSHFQMEPNESCFHLNDVLKMHDLTTSPTVMAIFAICYSIIIIFGVIGNSCVILSISRTRSLQTVPNMFIFSLSCSDIVVCFTSATITPITAFKKNWIFGGFLCSVAPFIAGVSLCFSTFTLAAISIDRFMLIRYPMKKPFSHFQASVTILLNCLLATILSAPAIFMQKLAEIKNYCGEYCYEDWGNDSSWRRVYGSVVLILQFIVPLTVIMLCYTAISLRLGQSLLLKTKKRNYEWQLQVTDQQRAANKRRQRTNRMFIAMVIAFSLSWVWSVLFNLLRDYDALPSFVVGQQFFVGILTHCIAMTSTVWNPILYALLNLQLRVAFLQLMPTCLRECFCSGLAAKTLSEEGLGKRHHSTFHRSAVNGNGTTAHKSPSNNNNCGTTLLIANGAALDDTFDDDVSRDSRYRSETKYGTLGFPGQGAKVEDSARQPLLAATTNTTTTAALSPNRFRSASFTNFGAEISSPPMTVTTERTHLAPPVRSSSARRKESFLLRDMLSSSRIARSFRKRRPQQQPQSPSISGRELDGVATAEWQLLAEATGLDDDDHTEPRDVINHSHSTGRPALLRCFLSDATQCQSLSLDAGHGDYFDGGTPGSRIGSTPGDRSAARGRLNTTGGGSTAGDPEWLSPGDKAARVLGLHGNDPFADLDDGRAAGWWQRRKSACSCIAPVGGTTGNGLIGGSASATNNNWGRSVSSRRLDDDPVPGQLLGLGGALMVPLATQRRSRSLTRSALTLLRTPIRKASIAVASVNRAASFSNSSAFSGSDEEPLVASSSSSSVSGSSSPLTGTTTANAGFFASTDDSEAEF